MKICGLKLTHDGAVCLVDNNVLKFCVEMEKINNNPRYTSIEEAEVIPKILADFGYTLDDVDVFAVDGWGGTDQDALAIQPRLEIGTGHNFLTIDNKGVTGKIGVAPYREKGPKDDILNEWKFSGFAIGESQVSYASYYHAAGHIMSAYCTSPFAAKNESAYVLVWDGGMFPCLYFVEAAERKVHSLGPLSLMIGNIYTIFSQHFGPFKVKGTFAKDNLSVAGKVMAYIALGKLREELLPIFEDIYTRNYDQPMGFANFLANAFKTRIEGLDISDEDVLYTFHVYLERFLIRKLGQKISRYPFSRANLCIAGGCALNIKWNSAIRDAGITANVYVPPFPNDSGSAIGAACCAMYKHTGFSALEWNVYSGPQVAESVVTEGWKEQACTIEALAALLHESKEPVVFINGRAELGPRALGNRSILASPESPLMKDILNFVKKREAYRPVSPICMEADAAEIFEPGTRDPYMLFDHRVRPLWKDRIPAVIHLDDTARLQTVAEHDNPDIYRLLKTFREISGLPMLCNTSANLNGSGFFPDARSVMEWGQVNYVYDGSRLYERLEKIEFRALISSTQEAIVA